MQSHRRRSTSNEATVIPLRASLVWRPRQRRSSRALAWSAGLLWLLFFALSGTLAAQSAPADLDPRIGEGANEILVVVRDSFDGLGVVARLEN